MNIIIILLLAVIAAILFYAVRQSAKASGSKAAGHQPVPRTIRNVRPGGVIHLARVGRDLDDMDVEITGRHSYREEGFEWYELEGEAAAGRVWIEIEDDDELEISITLESLRLGDVGLTPEAVAAIEKRDSGAIEYAGTEYEYEDCGEADFLRHGDPQQREHLRYWDFESADEKWFLTVEAWGEREYQVHISQALSPSQIEVYRVGGETHG